MITISEEAKQKILESMNDEEAFGMALRLAVVGRGPAGFRYSLGFVPSEDKSSEDAVIEEEGFQVYIDSESIPKLQGATLEYASDSFPPGFKIDNPNPLWTDPIAQAVQKVIDQQINPGIVSHGGFITLLDVKEGVAYIQFGGGCQGCGMVDVTLKDGVEVKILEAVPEIKQVLDTTNHSRSVNPYYQAG